MSEVLPNVILLHEPTDNHRDFDGIFHGGLIGLAGRLSVENWPKGTRTVVYMDRGNLLDSDCAIRFGGNSSTIYNEVLALEAISQAVAS